MFPFYMMLTKFFKNSVVVSSDFSMMKIIVSPSPSSDLQIKLISCFKSVFSNSICLLKSIVISF